MTTLLRALRQESEHLKGELILGHLCELTIDTLDEKNKPSGTCAFCLEQLGGTEDVVSSVVKLECFHSYHAQCFWDWFRWKQHELGKRENEILSAYKTLPMASKALESERIRKTTLEGHSQELVFYEIACPCCRLTVSSEYLLYYAKDLMTALVSKT